MTTQNKYDEDFKKSLVSLYPNGKTQSQLCREYGVSKSALSKWIRPYSTVQVEDSQVLTAVQVSESSAWPGLVSEVWPELPPENPPDNPPSYLQKHFALRCFLPLLPRCFLLRPGFLLLCWHHWLLLLPTSFHTRQYSCSNLLPDCFHLKTGKLLPFLP